MTPRKKAAAQRTKARPSKSTRKRGKAPARESGRRLSSEERRRQIIEAVEELFKTRPYAEIGVPDVAAALGITQGLVYHYFPTKEALLVAAVELRAQELLRFCLSDASQPFLLQVEKAVKGYVDYVEAHSVAYVNLFTGPSAAEPEILRICEETRQAFIEHFLRAIHLDVEAMRITRLSLRGYFGYAECVILKWLEQRSVSRQVIERLCLSAAHTALITGLRSERESPLSAAQIEQLSGAYRQHFKL